MKNLLIFLAIVVILGLVYMFVRGGDAGEPCDPETYTGPGQCVMLEDGQYIIAD